MTVSGVDLGSLARLASDTLRRHGVGAAGAGWADAESQALRFQMLARAVGLRPRASISVNDLGCGYGALYDYLKLLGVDVTAYHGYDVSADMLEAARAHLPFDHAHFVKAPRIAATADFSFLSGPLNLKTAEDEAWKVYAKSVILDLAAHSRSGFAFNMMTTKVTYRVSNLYYADPAEWLAWCREEIAAEFTLVQDYPLYEWTIGGSYETAP